MTAVTPRINNGTIHKKLYSLQKHQESTRYSIHKTLFLTETPRINNGTIHKNFTPYRNTKNQQWHNSSKNFTPYRNTKNQQWHNSQKLYSLQKHQESTMAQFTKNFTPYRNTKNQQWHNSQKTLLLTETPRINNGTIHKKLYSLQKHQESTMAQFTKNFTPYRNTKNQQWHNSQKLYSLQKHQESTMAQFTKTLLLTETPRINNGTIHKKLYSLQKHQESTMAQFTKNFTPYRNTKNQQWHNSQKTLLLTETMMQHLYKDQDIVSEKIQNGRKQYVINENEEDDSIILSQPQPQDRPRKCSIMSRNSKSNTKANNEERSEA
ncbi:unnamed protein product [Mytilus coruscus]|uniref:Uncharacterized protein n=1 Tax=Mytilus coruscus TaxID=42192 RepID=A0A6J8BAH6_MYTCO|nr:unnamed protein product [Mytilus coruscus]